MLSISMHLACPCLRCAGRVYHIKEYQNTFFIDKTLPQARSEISTTKTHPPGWFFRRRPTRPPRWLRRCCWRRLSSMGLHRTDGCFYTFFLLSRMEGIRASFHISPDVYAKNRKCGLLHCLKVVTRQVFFQIKNKSQFFFIRKTLLSPIFSLCRASDPKETLSSVGGRDIVKKLYV